MSEYLADVILPSNGHLYGGKYKKLVIRDMGTKEEKLIYGSTASNTLDRVIKNCVVEPKDFDLSELVDADKHFIMMKLRIHTYGSDYGISYRCPECGAKCNVAINLDNLGVTQLDSDSDEIEVELPLSKDKLKLKLLTGKDHDIVESAARRRAKSSKKAKYDELVYIMDMAKHIVSVNGEDIDFVDAIDYVNEMHGKDSAYFWYKLNSIKFGYDSTVQVTCDACGQEVEVPLPINEEFFRPKFD